MVRSRLENEQVVVRRRHRTSALIAAATAVLVGGLLAGAQAPAQVNPSSHATTLAPGQSQSITKTVTVAPVLDFVLDVDLSGSYGDDLPNIQEKAPGIFDALAARSTDLNAGLVTFVDIPYSPWGSPPDFGYRRDQDLTPDKATWTGAVNAMTLFSGGDGPESQYLSLQQAATGTGLEPPAGGTGACSPDVGRIPAGQGISWRPDSARLLAITTDASFHVKGDSGGTCEFPYPGPSRDEAIQALLDQRVQVIALKAPGSGSEMDDVAAATGGAVVTTDSSSEQIAEAIVTAFASLRFDISAAPTACAPLQISFDPPVLQGVAPGTEVSFTETISVPSGAAPGTVRCNVNFLAGESLIGTQTIEVRIPGADCTNEIIGTSAPRSPGRANDKLTGTDGSDLIKGKSGNDKLRGLGGDDCMRGGPGLDKLGGGDGSDTLNGGQKPDVLKGGSGDDLIKARAGRVDLISCGPGKDTARVESRDVVKRNCEKVKVG
jgi:RTX calcium-binding nonapeptide repeat (4 copies)/Integrin beta chain VWA domain